MFRSKTVFVLGAGASAEVGLPVGEKLLKQISKLIDIRYGSFNMESGDGHIADALKLILDEGRSVDKYNEHLRVAWQVISSAEQALSIDNIVDGLEDPRVELVAKLGIVRAIQKAEEKSAYFGRFEKDIRRLDLQKFEDTWYSHLTKLLCENRRKSDIDNIFENLAFVSFNYDRCIERYLPTSIANYYGMDISSVLPAFRAVKIHRPYGIAGNIEWDHAGNVQGFGAGSVEQLAKAASMIRTFSEGAENPDSLARLKLDLAEADRIIFLGTAFHRQNLELLRTKVNPTAQILATSGNISDQDLEVIKDELHDVFSMRKDESCKRVNFAKMHCREFFETYWRTLTA